MAKLSSTEVKHIAHLSNLKLTPKEEKAYQDQLTKIINYFDELSSVNTTNIEPLFSPIELKNIYTDDTPGPGLSQEEALKNAKSVDNGLFLVPGILKRD
ncbi:MAG: hypothetical protein A3D26_04830 [Candidatus Blackburnbacteria bacterium RIFCSPHIGHO2_02_FULL_44_20]|uniref:Aspartyl/glutamyl-tRNA(Asn/Gln) amidotransferase subunit C n=1 Tax=Candidatus Blackburnbacteria bacterium RIFCSPHIGHO2_02_FULL_44_20 TaxID=1797516 RepID=A0A1G1V4H3_9BACT|nr:MAG: hypothetical protein A3D26_04830 [Candidatus Blackburnbacteria bacterium RIFCSPHIGHO2_02_FULL_44_20]